MCKEGWCVVDWGKRELDEGRGNYLKNFKKGQNATMMLTSKLQQESNRLTRF